MTKVSNFSRSRAAKAVTAGTRAIRRGAPFAKVKLVMPLPLP